MKRRVSEAVLKKVVAKKPDAVRRRELARAKSGKLVASKRLVIAASLSAKAGPVKDARESFGFIPAGVSARVVRWPDLDE